MNYNFFAAKEDKIAILEYLFQNTDLKFFHMYSSYEEEITEYKNVEEIQSKFDLSNGAEFEKTFQLWSPKFKGKVFFEKIELDPRSCEGYTFRYSTRGMGLIQLYFGGVQNNELNQSHIGHTSLNRAAAYQGLNNFTESIYDWDWGELNRMARRLKYQIHQKMAVRKIGAMGILSGAKKLGLAGIKYR